MNLQPGDRVLLARDVEWLRMEGRDLKEAAAGVVDQMLPDGRVRVMWDDGLLTQGSARDLVKADGIRSMPRVPRLGQEVDGFTIVEVTPARNRRGWMRIVATQDGQGAVLGHPCLCDPRPPAVPFRELVTEDEGLVCTVCRRAQKSGV